MTKKTKIPRAKEKPRRYGDAIRKLRDLSLHYYGTVASARQATTGTMAAGEAMLAAAAYSLAANALDAARD